MLTLPGYQIQKQLHSGVRTAIYRGFDEQQKRSVVVKVLQSENLTLEEITRLRQEYTLTQNLNFPGILKAYSLEKCRNGFALILEDIGGQSLQELITSEKLPLIEGLKIGIKIAETLEYLHQIPIIHKDIKPSNIIINPESWEVKLSDFSIASRLKLENPTISNPQLIEGTFAYMSPEQTGRMNRAIDYRTDFYSLGMSLYEILTETLPFITNDPLELVHCHIAKQPIPPSQIDPGIPEIISAIVMKLLAKTAEARYQNAAGIKFDLVNCLDQLEKKGEIENFVLGRQDTSNQLLIPQKLYGRETEVEKLLAAFERVSQGAIELMLVSGYSGIGKTSVINEVHKPIVGARGYFIAGKFDQFKRNIPYAALIQAFDSLVNKILTESAEKIAIWQKKLDTAWGENGKVIAEVIPQIELIIGKQPELPHLSPSESEKRFHRVFQQFIQVFCQPGHPLVIFLDDLQWADSASLKLMELLLEESFVGGQDDHEEGRRQHLLIIGAYRDNEVSPTHPLIQTLDKIQKTGAVVNNITLQPLAKKDIRELLADTLHESTNSLSPVYQKNEVNSLSDLLFNKTQGNPFFLTQILKNLVGEKLLTYHSELSKWNWDIQEIQKVGITDYNVVQLLARNIENLPKATQDVLKFAACIGNQFNLDILAIVNQTNAIKTAMYLWDALQVGLVLPLSDSYKIPLLFGEDELENETAASAISYKFLHDRVQPLIL